MLVVAWRLHRSSPRSDRPPRPPSSSPPVGPPPGPHCAPKAPPSPAPEDALPSRSPSPGPVLSSTVRIGGRLLNRKREPLAGQTVEVFALDPLRSLTRWSIGTDARGEFQVEVPGDSRVTLTAHVPGEGRIVYPITASAAGSPLRSVTLTTRAPISLDGVALRADGSPLAQARLLFHPLSTTYVDPDEGPLPLNLISGSAPPDEEWDRRCRHELFLTDCEVMTDADGGFHAQSLTTRTNYRVEAALPGGERPGADLSTQEIRGRIRIQFPK
jgi:hypothetical protein